MLVSNRFIISIILLTFRVVGGEGGLFSMVFGVGGSKDWGGEKGGGHQPTSPRELVWIMRNINYTVIGITKHLYAYFHGYAYYNENYMLISW